MGFLSASVSITRYTISDEIPQTLWAEIPERLRKFSFIDIDHTTDERSFGWVSFEDYLDPDWKAAPPEKGEYLAWQLRLDTRRIQPAVMKKHFQIACNNYLASIQDEDKKFISKARKEELKEQTIIKLRTKAMPIPAMFEVIWNTSSNAIYLGSTNSKVRELFEDHFTQTFELGLEPQTPFFLATRMLGEEVVSRLENLEPTTFG